MNLSFLFARNITRPTWVNRTGGYTSRDLVNDIMITQFTSRMFDFVCKFDKSSLEIFALVTGLKQRIQQINLFLTLVGTGLTELKKQTIQNKTNYYVLMSQIYSFKECHT